MKKFSILILVACLSGCSGTRENPKQFSQEMAALVTGKASIQTVTNAWLTLSIYNGSEWNIADVDVMVENRKTKEQRRFRFGVTTTEPKRNDKGEIVGRTEVKSAIKPLSEENIEGYIGDFLSGATGAGDWTWSIVGARGFK